MTRSPRADPSWGYDLRQALGGSFTARPRSLLASEFILLNSNAQEFGRLRLRGLPAAEFESRDYPATLETSGGRYRMIAEDGEILTAAPKRHSTDELEISCDGRTYGARVSLLRNLALASHPGGERVVCLSGGLTSRSYEALFAAGDGCALPVAIFLLWHVVTNRRRAYRAYRMGSPRGGEAM
jgi:hypothetical protein